MCAARTVAAWLGLRRRNPQVPAIGGFGFSLAVVGCTGVYLLFTIRGGDMLDRQCGGDVGPFFCVCLSLPSQLPVISCFIGSSYTIECLLLEVLCMLLV